jgi:hypothetical protein
MNGKLRKLIASLILEVFWDGTWTGLKSLQFSDRSNLISLGFQQSSQLQNGITPKSFIVSMCANNRWKAEKVFYKFGIQILTRFQTQQSQSQKFSLLLIVKSGLMAVPKFSFWHSVGRLEDDRFPCCTCSFLLLFIIGFALKVGIERVITLEPPWTRLNHISFGSPKGTCPCHPFSLVPLDQSWPW